MPKTRLLIVHLEALGAVLRSTGLLAAIKRKYPDSHITWITQRPAEKLLENNPFIDRVLTTEIADLLVLSALSFDLAFCIDKSLKAVGILRQTCVDRIYGFTADARTGAIVPASEAARELWDLGLDDGKKFFVNQKSETCLTREALELSPPSDVSRSAAADDDHDVMAAGASGGMGTSDEYVLHLTEAETREARNRRVNWLGRGRWLIGINTGCSSVIPHKKLSIEKHRELVRRLNTIPGARVVLLGGREDELRNQRIGHGLDCVRSSTRGGLRDGLISVEACDLIVSGDSLGMHMGIALRKWVVAWFGPTCAQEIELYGRGVKVLSEASCAPCWKRGCDKAPMCYDLVQIDELLAGVLKGIVRLSATSIEAGIQVSQFNENNQCSQVTQGIQRSCQFDRGAQKHSRYPDRVCRRPSSGDSAPEEGTAP